MRSFLKALGLLAFCALLLAAPTQALAQGEALFKANCASCHKLSDQRSTGPGLLGSIDRWGGNREELVKFIRGGAKAYVDGGGPQAAYVKDLIAQFNGVLMAAQPVSEADANAILDYMAAAVPPAAAAGADAAAAAQAPVDVTPLYSGLWILVAVLLFAVISLISIIAVVLIAIRAKEEGTQFTMSRVFGQLRAIRRNRFVGGLVAFLVVFAVFAGIVDFARGIGLQQGYSPAQPIAFSHKLHAGQYEIDCEYCHIGVNKGKSATIPSTNICQNCHHERGGIVESQYQFANNPNIDATEEIGKVLASAQNNKPIEWVRIHNLPDLVYFNHAQHVNVAGLECNTCHGPVEEMEEVYQHSVLSMGWCINCHRQTEVDITKSEYYRSIHGAYIGLEQGLTVEQLGGINCARCHY